MHYKSLTNHELIKKLKEAEDFDSVLALSAEVCERAGLAAQWARAAGFAVGAPSVSNLDSILCLAIEKLTGA
jgi:hypothetical protein